VGKPPLGASRSANPGSWRGGRTEPVPQAVPRRTSPWPDRRRHLRAPGSSDRISDRGAEPKGTPDRSKLIGSQRERSCIYSLLNIYQTGSRTAAGATRSLRGRSAVFLAATCGPGLPVLPGHDMSTRQSALFLSRPRPVR
jgi:hypothetical protein